MSEPASERSSSHSGAPAAPSQPAHPPIAPARGERNSVSGATHFNWSATSFADPTLSSERFVPQFSNSTHAAMHFSGSLGSNGDASKASRMSAQEWTNSIGNGHNTVRRDIGNANGRGAPRLSANEWKNSLPPTKLYDRPTPPTIGAVVSRLDAVLPVASSASPPNPVAALPPTASYPNAPPPMPFEKSAASSTGSPGPPSADAATGKSRKRGARVVATKPYEYAPRPAGTKRGGAAKPPVPTPPTLARNVGDKPYVYNPQPVKGSSSSVLQFPPSGHAASPYGLYPSSSAEQFVIPPYSAAGAMPSHLQQNPFPQQSPIMNPFGAPTPYYPQQMQYNSTDEPTPAYRPGLHIPPFAPVPGASTPIAPSTKPPTKATAKPAGPKTASKAKGAPGRRPSSKSQGIPFAPSSVAPTERATSLGARNYPIPAPGSLATLVPIVAPSSSSSAPPSRGSLPATTSTPLAVFGNGASHGSVPVAALVPGKVLGSFVPTTLPTPAAYVAAGLPIPAVLDRPKRSKKQSKAIFEEPPTDDDDDFTSSEDGKDVVEHQGDVLMVEAQDETMEPEKPSSRASSSKASEELDFVDDGMEDIAEAEGVIRPRRRVSPTKKVVEMEAVESVLIEVETPILDDEPVFAAALPPTPPRPPPPPPKAAKGPKVPKAPKQGVFSYEEPEAQWTIPPNHTPIRQVTMEERTATLTKMAQPYIASKTNSQRDQARNVFVQQWIVYSYELAGGGNVCRPAMYKSFLEGTTLAGIDTQINSASFGKAIRAAYPKIEVRRLGHRGASTYHYTGIRASNSIEASTIERLNKEEFGEPLPPPASTGVYKRKSAIETGLEKVAAAEAARLNPPPPPRPPTSTAPSASTATSTSILAQQLHNELTAKRASEAFERSAEANKVDPNEPVVLGRGNRAGKGANMPKARRIVLTQGGKVIKKRKKTIALSPAEIEATINFHVIVRSDPTAQLAVYHQPSAHALSTHLRPVSVSHSSTLVASTTTYGFTLPTSQTRPVDGLLAFHYLPTHPSSPSHPSALGNGGRRGGEKVVTNLLLKLGVGKLRVEIGERGEMVWTVASGQVRILADSEM